MSLKLFFMSLTEDELEFVCHNYIHNWINIELQRSNRLLSKYQVEQKLEYIKKTANGVGLPAENKSMFSGSSNSKAKLPRYMAPTIGEIKKRENPDQEDMTRRGNIVPLQD
jgi:hypothetical protein